MRWEFSKYNSGVVWMDSPSVEQQRLSHETFSMLMKETILPNHVWEPQQSNYRRLPFNLEYEDAIKWKP